MKINKKFDYVAKGKRSVIYMKIIDGEKIAYKVVLDIKRTSNVIEKEYMFLRLLNKYNIGPKVLKKGKDYVSYEFVEGKNFIDILNENNPGLIKDIIKDIIKQCYKLDQLKISKEEFHRPIKHILIKNRKPVLIDFERAHFSNNPKNVTQFCQFLILKNTEKILITNNITINKEEMIKNLKEYKKSFSYRYYLKIIAMIR